MVTLARVPLAPECIRKYILRILVATGNNTSSSKWIRKGNMLTRGLMVLGQGGLQAWPIQQFRAV